jgi:hypothetical protein
MCPAPRPSGAAVGSVFQSLPLPQMALGLRRSLPSLLSLAGIVHAFVHLKGSHGLVLFSLCQLVALPQAALAVCLLAFWLRCGLCACILDKHSLLRCGSHPGMSAKGLRPRDPPGTPRDPSETLGRVGPVGPRGSRPVTGGSRTHSTVYEGGWVQSTSGLLPVHFFCQYPWYV